MSESEKVSPVPFVVFWGLDVGKSEHHACALDAAGRRVHDKALPNDETALRTVLGALAQRGRVLVVVDQPASIGALAVAVARQMGIDVAYLPGGDAPYRRAAPRSGQDRRPRRARDRRCGTHHAAHLAPRRHRRRTTQMRLEAGCAVASGRALHGHRFNGDFRHVQPGENAAHQPLRTGCCGFNRPCACTTTLGAQVETDH